MPSRADALAVGALLALVARGSRGLAVLAKREWPLILGSGSLLGAIFLWRRGLDTEDLIVLTVGFSLLCLLFGAILSIALTAAPASRLGRLFSHPLLAFFGRYSYGLYVFHHPIAIALGSSAVGVEAWPVLLGSRIPAQVGFTIMATVLSLAIAMLSWHLYEAQVLKLKRYFDYGFKAR